MKVNGVGARLAIALIAISMFTSIVFIPRSQGQEEASEAPPALDKTETINVKVEFSAPQITAVRGYHRVGMEGLPNFGKPGEPELPIRPVRVLIPFGSEVVGVRVSHGRAVALDGFYTVEPAQKPVPLSSEAPVEFTPPDEEIYNCSTPFPARIYSDPFPQSKRGYKILILSLYPVSYVPSKGELSYFEDMTVEVEFRPAPPGGLSVKCSSEDRREIMRMVDNPEAIDSYPLELGPLGGGNEYEYVIITSEDLKNYSGDYDWQTLCDRKESRGITTEIVSLEWIYSNYGGRDNPENIRNFIRYAYENWGTKYVLLGGDDTVIPPRFLWVDTGRETENIPSDMYYSCLDGTFNYDDDGNWGEPTDGENGGEVDLYAEVYVGRAPVASGTDVSNFVRKTLAFEDFVPEDKYLAYMVGEWLGFGGVAEYATAYKEEVRLGSDNHDYTTVGFASCDFVETSTLYGNYGFWWSNDDLIDIINNGVWVLNHLGHNAKQYAMKLHTSYLYALTNTEYFFAYSQGCNAGHFDGGVDCWAEKVVRMEHGAAAVVMNARYGWGAYNSTNGSSQRFDREFWDAVFGENIYEMGRANSDSKENQAWYISSSQYGRWCAYELNLFGDPELRFVNLLVATIISPGENSGLPGSTLDYKVLVWNGDREDNYTLTASDIENWDLTLSENLLENMQPYEVREITLSATIPNNVDLGTDDEITVVVTSQENAEISDNAICKARVPPSRRVEVSIVPSEDLGCPDKWPDITFEITIKNTGIENDNYDLNVDDNAGWGLTLSDNLLENMSYNENRAVTLTVTIPDGTESGTVDNVTVTAVSHGDPSVSDNASCLARAGTRVIEDNFEDYEVGEFPSAGGWRTVWGGTGQNYVVDNVSVSGSKSFQLEGKDGWSAVIGRPLDFFAWKVGTWIGYEAYVRAEDIGGGEKSSAVLGFFIQTAETSGKFFACVNFKDDGTIESGGEVLGSFSADTWYKIRVMLDTSTDLYDVWIDGEPVGEGLETQDSHLIKSFAFCSSFALSSDYAGIKIYYDDVKVFLPPGKPVLASPNNGQILTDKTPTFTWTEGSNADNHRIEVDNDPDFSSVIDDETATENTWTKPSPGYALGTYYWRVWAVNAEGKNCSEDTWKFRITHAVIENISGYMEKGDYFYPPTTENKFLGAGKLEYVGQRFAFFRFPFPISSYSLVDNYSPLDWNVYPVENTHIQAVKTNDGDNTYIHTSIENKIDLFEVDNIAPDRWINNVIVCARVMRPGGTSGTAYLALQTYGTNYFSTSKDVGSYTYISASWTTNPYTNENWTKAEVDNLKVGIKSGATDNEIRCTYIYILVFWKNYSQYRGFISFDTSGISDDATVKSAKLYLAMQYDSSSTDFDVYFYSGQNQWTGTDDLSWGDCPDNQGIFFNTSEKTTNTYYSQTVAPSAISKTGRTQFRLTSSREESSIEPTGTEYIRFYAYDNPDYGPYLEVIFSPGKPVLVSPENDARSSDSTPTFIWAWAPNADNYRIEVDNDPDFSSVIDDETVTENTWTKPSPGYAPGTYYWRVWAVNAGGENCSENTWQFTIWAANFSLVNLYTVNVEQILDLNQGSKLVVKFYTYGDAYENENVIETFTPPWYVEENEHARHPGIGGKKKGVKKARLDLTTDDTGNVIATIASFTVRRVHLEIRFSKIPSEWFLAQPPERTELETEFSEIPSAWFLAPPSDGPLGLGSPISEPGGTTIEVMQGDNFLIRHTLEWNEPENGAYTVTMGWDCYDDHENENFTFLGAEAYFDLDNDNLPDPGLDPILAVVTLDSAPSWDYPSSTRYALRVSCPADNKDPRDGRFNVDIVMGAYGAGGVPHIPGDHVIPFQFGGIMIVEKYPQSWNRDPITIRVL